jgi:polysaccharide deacetylase 2 family uncharacterized protein YibQ
LAGRVSRAGKPLLLATLLVVALVVVAAGLYMMFDLGQGTEQPAVAHIAIEEETEAATDEAAGTPTTSATTTSPAPEPDAPTAPEPVTSDAATPPPPEPEIPDWQRFAAAAEAQDARPRIAVVVTGLGLAADATDKAIRTLPAEVSLSFTPYAKDLETWVDLARSHGHEVLLDLPMEPTTFPNDDPGPRALITSLSAEENLERLNWILERAETYVGLAGFMGSRFSSSEAQLRPVFQVLMERGLLYLDNRSTDGYVAARLARKMGLAHAVNSRLLDDRHASRPTIDARLAQIERVALTDQVAVAMARPFPITLERLSAWLSELDEETFQLVPLTAIVNRQPAY